MSSIFVGVDISRDCLRVAALSVDKESSQIHSVSKKPFSNEEELSSALRQIFTGDLARPKRVALAVPARKGFFRQLNFPFPDPKKITSALPYELASVLPVDMDNYMTGFQKPVARDDGGYFVPAAAVSRQTLTDIITPFDQTDVPLHEVNLAPFAYAEGLGTDLKSCLLACTNQNEITVSLVEHGRVVDYRLFLSRQETPPEEILDFIHTQSLFFKNRSTWKDLPLCVISSEPIQELIAALKNRGHVIVEALSQLDGYSPESEFLPAALLALSAFSGKKSAGFNFRKGPLALKSDWVALKKQFIFSGILASLVIVTLAASFVLTYSARSTQLSRLDNQIKNIYKTAFPESKNIIDVPLQMQSQLRELEKRGALFKIGKLPSPLRVLKEISQRLGNIPGIDLRTYSYDMDAVRIEGTTGSFEAVNRMSGELKKAELFEDIEITEAKMSLDGQHVNFRVHLNLKGGPSKS